MNSSTAAAGASHRPKPPAADQDAGRKQGQEERQPFKPLEVEVASEKSQKAATANPRHAPPGRLQRRREAFAPPPQHQQGEGRHEKTVRVLRLARQRPSTAASVGQYDQSSPRTRQTPSRAAIRRLTAGDAGTAIVRVCGAGFIGFRTASGGPQGDTHHDPHGEEAALVRPRRGEGGRTALGSKQLACRDGFCRGEHRTGIACRCGSNPCAVGRRPQGKPGERSRIGREPLVFPRRSVWTLRGETQGVSLR